MCLKVGMIEEGLTLLGVREFEKVRVKKINKEEQKQRVHRGGRKLRTVVVIIYLLKPIVQQSPD